MHVSVKVELSMGHRLLGYPGLCSYLHGHNYSIEVEVQGNPDKLGLVIDFSHLKRELNHILEPLDHAMALIKSDPAVDLLRVAGEKLVVFSVNPSAENIAGWVFNRLVDGGIQVTKVSVRETTNSVAIATGVDRKVTTATFKGSRG